jgi:CBS domain containing-hemolysin-like protein
MPKADHLNEELGCLELCFAAFLAIAMLVVAWLVQNYLTVDSAIIVGAFIIISIVTYLLVWIIRYAYKRIEQLGISKGVDRCSCSCGAGWQADPRGS